MAFLTSVSIASFVGLGCPGAVVEKSKASIAVARTVATDQAMLNKGVDDVYATGDLVEASILQSGATAWMFIASGQTIVHGNKLESAGDGTLKIFSAGVVLFKALENKTATALTRLRVEAL